MAQSNEEKDVNKMERTMINVPHVQQSLSWDSGLACLRMIAKFCHINIDFQKACKELGMKTSVWIIDLAYIMAKYKAKAEFRTATPAGVDSSRYKLILYNANRKDLRRARMLFERAVNFDIVVKLCSTSSEDIAQHILSNNGPVVALVDYNHLFCDSCSQTCMLADTDYSMYRRGDNYLGHYIIICGVDVTMGVFYYRNPSLHDEMCTCSFQRMDKARFQFWIDKEVLLIYPPDRTG